MNVVVLDASAAAEIALRTLRGRQLLALAPRDRTWWVPDLFHVEAAGAIRRLWLMASSTTPEPPTRSSSS